MAVDIGTGTVGIGGGQGIVSGCQGAPGKISGAVQVGGGSQGDAAVAAGAIQWRRNRVGVREVRRVGAHLGIGVGRHLCRIRRAIEWRRGSHGSGRSTAVAHAALVGRGPEGPAPGGGAGAVAPDGTGAESGTGCGVGGGAGGGVSGGGRCFVLAAHCGEIPFHATVDVAVVRVCSMAQVAAHGELGRCAGVHGVAAGSRGSGSRGTVAGAAGGLAGAAGPGWGGQGAGGQGVAMAVDAAGSGIGGCIERGAGRSAPTVPGSQAVGAGEGAVGHAVDKAGDIGAVDGKAHIDGVAGHRLACVAVVAAIAPDTAGGDMDGMGAGIARSSAEGIGGRRCQAGAGPDGGSGGRVAVADVAGGREGPGGVIVIVAGVADARIGAAVLGWVVAPRRRHVVASLADAGSLLVHIFPLAAGVAVEDLAGLPRLGHMAPNQIDVGPLGVVRVSGVIVDMGGMAIEALDILSQQIMALLAGMAVGADIQRVRLAAGHLGPAGIRVQKVAVTAAQVGEIGLTVNSGTARIGVVHPMAGGAEQGPVGGSQLGIEIGSGIGGIGVHRRGFERPRLGGCRSIIVDTDRMAPLQVGLHVAGAVTVEAELVLIVLNPLELAVGIVVRAVAADASQCVAAPFPQRGSGHKGLDRRLGSGSRDRVRPVPAMGCLLQPGYPGCRMVLEWICGIRQGKRVFPGSRVARPVAVQADIVVPGAAQGDVRNMAGGAGEARGCVVGCIGRMGAEGNDEGI